MAAPLTQLCSKLQNSIRQLSTPTSLEISDRTSTVTSVLRGDHRPSTFRPHNFSPSPSHPTIRREVNWAADSIIRLTINTCTYIPEMSRRTEHQFVTQTSEKQTDRTHTHAADNPLSTLLKTVSWTVQHPPQYYAALPRAVCSSAAITECYHERRCRSLLLVRGKRTAIRHACPIAAPHNVCRCHRADHACPTGWQR